MTSASAMPDAAQTPHWPDLTLAVNDTQTLQQVLLAHRRVQLRALLTIPVSAVGARVRPLLVATQRGLKAIARQQLSVALDLMQWPTHNVLVAVIAKALAPGGDRADLDDWVEELCLLTWLELARTGALPQKLAWTLRPGGPALRNIAANLHVAAIDKPAPITIRPRALDVAGQQVSLIDEERPLPEAPLLLARPYHRIIDGVVLATSDNNPLSDFEAHPDKDGNTLDLGDRSAARWCEVLQECFALVDRHLPLLGAELKLVARQIVPVGFDPEKHLSASYKESIGTAYMSLHPNLMTMAEAVIHELQHNKLNAAAYVDPLLRNAFWPLFTSPVRPDPRPLWGVLLAVHAFQPVAALYEQMLGEGCQEAANPSFSRRYRQIVAKNHDGATTVLGNGEATALGQQLLDEMTQLDERFKSVWSAEVPS